MKLAVLMMLFASLCGCATTDQSGGRPTRTTSAEQRPHSWQRGDTVYEDRNGDGVVDYERRGHPVLDGAGPGMTIFIDDDYDGFYDREIVTDEDTNEQKTIHVAVPPRILFQK